MPAMDRAAVPKPSRTTRRYGVLLDSQCCIIKVNQRCGVARLWGRCAAHRGQARSYGVLVGDCTPPRRRAVAQKTVGASLSGRRTVANALVNSPTHSRASSLPRSSQINSYVLFYERWVATVRGLTDRGSKRELGAPEGAHTHSRHSNSQRSYFICGLSKPIVDIQRPPKTRQPFPGAQQLKAGGSMLGKLPTRKSEIGEVRSHMRHQFGLYPP